MSNLSVGVKEVRLGEDGFMLDWMEWDENVARELAKLVGIAELTPRHWDVIRYMRQESQEKGEGPSTRRLKNSGGIPTKELYELFPGGPAKKAARIAGIPKPHGCI